MRFIIIALLLSQYVLSVTARCYNPSPVHPPPNLSHNEPELRDVFNSVGASLRQIVSDKAFDISSFSVEITSSKETLWSLHHTARERNSSRIGAENIDGRSVYRIASITKVFTVLGILQQHAAGNLSLDDPITNYIEDLNNPQEGSIPWKDITLRSLASQLSGIPRECEFTLSSACSV